MSPRPVTLRHDTVNAIDTHNLRSIQVLEEGRPGDTEPDYKRMTWDQLFDHAFPDVPTDPSKDTKYSMRCTTLPLRPSSDVTGYGPDGEFPTLRADEADSPAVDSSSEEDDGDPNEDDDHELLKAVMPEGCQVRILAAYGPTEEQSPYKTVRLLWHSNENDDDLASFPMTLRYYVRGVLSTFDKTDLSKSILGAARITPVTNTTFSDADEDPVVPIEDLWMKQSTENKAWVRKEKLIPETLILKDGTTFDLVDSEATSIQSWEAGETVRCSARIVSSIGLSEDVPWTRGLDVEAMQLEMRSPAMEMRIKE